MDGEEESKEEGKEEKEIIRLRGAKEKTDRFLFERPVFLLRVSYRS